MFTTFDNFKQTVISELQSRLSDYEVTEQSVMKMNDIVLHGVTVRHKDSDVAPTMYLDASFENYLRGQSIESIVQYLEDAVLSSETVAPIRNAEEMNFSFDNIKDKLALRLIDTELNTEYLKSHKYGLVGAGLAIVAEVNLGNGYRCVITNDIADQNDLNMSMIFTIAMENMQKKHPAKLINMETALFGGESENILDSENTELTGMSVLQSDGMESFGAIALVYKGLTDKIYDLFGNCFILPSSVHECILVNDSFDADELKQMVIQANRTVVDAQDVLSNSVFKIDAYGLSRVA